MGPVVDVVLEPLPALLDQAQRITAEHQVHGRVFGVQHGQEGLGGAGRVAGLLPSLALRAARMGSKTAS